MKGDGCAIPDNNYMQAFDMMVLLWVFKIMAAMGLDKSVIDRFRKIYRDNITMVVVNNIIGKGTKNVRWSICQGDRPISFFLNY